MEYNSITEFIQKKHYKVVNSYVKSHFNKEKRQYKSRRFLENVVLRDVKKIDIINTKNIQLLETELISFEIELIVTFHEKEFVNYAHAKKVIKKIVEEKVFVETNVMLNNGIKKMKFLSVKKEPYYKYIEGKTLTKHLVPYMSAKNLESYAESFLEKLCPEALNEPMVLPVNNIVKKLGLKKVYTKLPSNILGKICFRDVNKNICLDDGSISRCKAKKGTILINDNINKKYKTSENVAIVHECIHWLYHKNFFELLFILNPKIKSIFDMENLNFDIEKDYLITLNYIECFAQQLSYRIIMPKKTIIMKYEEEMTIIKGQYPNITKSEMCEKAIKVLAEYFNVSKLSMKIRLCQLGIKEAHGTYCYVDDQYHKPFEGANLVHYNTKEYLVSFKNAIKLYSKNPTLRKLLDERKIVYANGFFVLNNKLYIEYDENKKIVLTDYARSHIDECCLEFDISYDYKNKGYDASCYWLSSAISENKKNVDIDAKSIQNSRIIGVSGDMSVVIEELEEAEMLLTKMNKTFSDGLKLLFKKSGIASISDLSRLSKIDRKTLNSYFEGRTIPNLEKVLALCAALELYPSLSYRLIELAGLSLGRRGKPIDQLYMFLIGQCYHEGLDSWNERIKKVFKHEYLP